MAMQKPTEQGMGSNNNFNNAEVKGTGDEEKKEEPVTNSQRGVDQEKNDLTKLSSLKLRDRTSVLSNEINTLRSEIKELKEREKELKEDCESLEKGKVEALGQVDGEKTNNVTNINNMKKIIEERYDELIRKNKEERNGILAEIEAKESEINKKEEERKNIWGEVERRDVANKAAEELKIGDPDFSSEMVKNLIKEFARIVKGNDRGEPNDSDEETANNDKSSQPVTDQQEAVANKAAEELKIGDPDFLREMVENQIKEFNRIVKENDGKKLNDSDEEREQAVNSHEQGEKEASEIGSDGGDAVGGSETGENATGDEEKAETEKPAKKTEAEKLYGKDCALLEEKEGVLKKWQDVQKTWQARYDAATRKVRDRSKRARYSYEILRAEAQITTADIEVKRLKEIVGVSAKMVDAEKEFGADSEEYIEAKNERERLYKLYQGYIDEVGEVQEVDRNKKGIIKDGDQRGQDRLNLKPAKPSKLKAFWNKIKKPFIAFVAVATVAAAITGVVHGTKYLGKVDDPNTNPPIEQPADDSKDNELVDEIDKNFDTGSLTDEDKQQIEDKLEEVGSITSMVKVEGVEGVSYRKDGNVDKVNIYITTQAGSIIEYQTQVTKDEISELATTEGVTAKDVVDLILSDVSKSTPSVSYKKIDETKYSQLISNIYSDAEDIEFPDPGKDGNYTSFYFKIDNTRNEKGDVGNVDFLAIGPDSVVKVDDRVEYQTATGKNLNLRDPSALLNMIERSLGGNASTSGFSGEIETKFNSTSYFQTHKDENSQVEEAEAIQNIMDEAVAKTEKELSNDELTR